MKEEEEEEEEGGGGGGGGGEGGARERKEKERKEKEIEEKKKEKVGIAMARLIKDDPHISDAANNMGSYCVLRGRVNGIGYPLNERLIPYLEQAGFGSAALIRTFDLRYDLISALVERLPIDGSPVTGVSAFAEPTALCYSLLGDLPDDDNSIFLGLKFTWLRGKFEHLSANATEGELMCAARAYIMHIIVGVLMPDTNNNNVHIMYLPLLADLNNVRSCR
ncbi:hypothetical protein J1N35_000208 [Gossypium stocksii]|uniref:Uncharacterized protein n=1 Tax=Gossypium stocksii TaxID=47602 RepID=A0A9D3WGS0_9ROSI|nr:hypothetical protein J1N35_000208 [Gossypium stocksii]